jgi:hypothetical protein
MIFSVIIKAEDHGPDLLVWVELRGFDSLWKLSCQGVAVSALTGVCLWLCWAWRDGPLASAGRAVTSGGVRWRS